MHFRTLMVSADTTFPFFELSNYKEILMTFLVNHCSENEDVDKPFMVCFLSQPQELVWPG